MKSRSNNAFAILSALWITILAAAVVAAVQVFSMEQSARGTEAIARTRALWAARAGIEATIARLAFNTEQPDLASALTVVDDMVDVARGDLGVAGGQGASYEVAHAHRRDAKDVLGPFDEHSLLNVHTMGMQQLMNMPLMSEEIVAGLIDWTDSDDDVTIGGAEISQYMALPRPYEPRNAPMRSIEEMELFLFADRGTVRGEDWNGNLRLDASEADGVRSWPVDDGNGVLDRGWAGLISARSVGGGLSASGQQRLVLREGTQSASEDGPPVASTGDLISRLKVNDAQARVIEQHAQTAQTLGDFVRTPLNRLRDPETNQPINTGVEPLTADQLVLLLDECALESLPRGSVPGKLNLNTADEEVLELIGDPGSAQAADDTNLGGRTLTTSTNSDAASAIVSARAGVSGKGGFTSIVDLLSVPGFTPEAVAEWYEIADVRSNVYVVPVRGRDQRTGLEVEMIAVLERSDLPVVIKEIRVR